MKFSLQLAGGILAVVLIFGFVIPLFLICDGLTRCWSSLTKSKMRRMLRE